MDAVRLLLHRVRGDAGLLTLLVVVVAVTVGLVGAVPRLLTELARDSLAGAVEDARSDQLGLAATAVRPSGAATAAAATGRLAAGTVPGAEQLPPELAAVLDEPTVVVDSARYDLDPLPGEPTDPLERRLTVRVQPGAEDRVTLVEGELPDRDLGAAEVVLPSTEPDAVTLRVLPFAATRDTADALAMAVGDRRVGTPDPTGPVLSRLVVRPDTPVVLELVGIVELTPVDDPVWFADPRLHRPSQFDSNVTTEIYAFGLLPADVASLLPGADDGDPAAVTVRWPLDDEALLDADVAAVADAARALRVQAPLDPAEPRWATGLDRVLDAEAARRVAAVEVLGIGAVSVVGVTGVLLAVVAGLLAARRRDAAALARGRGTSRPQLLAADAAEAVGVGVAGLLLGSVVLAVVLPRGGWLVPLAVAAGAVVVLVGGAVPDLRRSLGALLADRRRPGEGAGGRPVLEGLLVVVAVVAVLALRRRGVEPGGGADALVVAAPLLVGAAVAVLAGRLVPLPVRAAAAAAARLRSLVLALGLARAARGRGANGVVVLVVLGVGVAGLAAAVHASLDAGHERAAAERVGADVRVDAPPLTTLPSDLVADADAVTVPLSSVDGSLVTDVGAQRVDVLLVDAAGVEALGSDRGTLPSLAWDGTGATPVVVSSVLRPAGSPGVDDTVTVLLGTTRVAGRIVAIDPRVLGLDDERDGAFVVLDRAAAVAATGVDPGATSLLVRTDEPTAVADAVEASDVDADVLVRDRVAAALRDAPLARGVRLGFLVAAVTAALATLLALGLAVTAGGPERRRRAAVLLAVGSSSSGSRAVALVELLPAVGLAAAAGVALSAGLAGLLGDRLDLRSFTGTVDATVVGAPPVTVAAGLVVAVLLVTAGAAVLSLGRVDVGTLLREGDG